MVNVQDIRMIRFGSPEPLPERHVLRAGLLTAVLEDGGLRYIRFGGKELIRGIYAAVRDRNWGTIKPAFRDVEIEQGADSFRVRFVAEHRRGEIDFVWEGAIDGSADGMIAFSFDGMVRSAFMKNRIGFCVLHPAELAGVPVEVDTPSGLVAGAFPARISPHQPYKDMLAIRHEAAPGLTAELRFEGELFEMEDQRNWTDASYKTYCTPLSLPFPVEVEPGRQIRQRVTLRLIGELAAWTQVAGDDGVNGEINRVTAETSSPEAQPQPQSQSESDSRIQSEFQPQSQSQPQPHIAFRDVPAGRLPLLGLGHTPDSVLGKLAAERLRAIRPAFLRATIRLTEPDWAAQLHHAAAHAGLLGCGLELEALLPDGADRCQAQAEQLAAAIVAAEEAHRQSQPLSEPQPQQQEQPVRRRFVEAVFPFRASAYVSEGGLLSLFARLRDEAGLDFRVVGGSRAYYAQFGRAVLPLSEMEAAMFTMNPQVHAFDAASMAESASAQGEAVRSAKAIAPGMPVAAGPITFKPRLNPDATSAEAALAAEDRAGHEDARQWSLFGAGWTLGSLKSLAEAGAEQACYYETAGPLGVLPDGGQAQGPYPLYHVLAAAGPFQGAALLDSAVQDRLSYEAMALLRDDGSLIMLVANYTDETKRLRIEAPFVRPVSLRLLDERGISQQEASGEFGAGAYPQPQAFPAPVVQDGCFELELLPFAVAIVEGTRFE